MYTDAALQRMLTNSFAEYMAENGRYPTMAYLLSTVHVGSERDSRAIRQFYREDEIADGMAAELGLKAKYLIKNIFLDEVKVTPERKRSNFQSESVRLGYLSGIEDHINIISGSLYSDEIDDGVIDVIVSQKAQISLNLLLGEVLRLENIFMDDGVTPYRVRIAGIYENSAADDHYWYKSPNSYSSDLMMPESVFNRLFSRLDGLNYKVMGLLFVIMDYTGVTVDNAEYKNGKAQEYASYHEGLNNCRYNDYYHDILKRYLTEAVKVKVTLQILQIPIYALLAAFIFMVSGQILNMEQGEISVLKSRGASRNQLISIYLLQSGIIGAVSLAAGLPLSILICQILGSANAFLEFVSRRAREGRFNAQVAAFALTATLCSVAAMVLPVFKYAKLSIVVQKQKKRRSDKPFYQRFFIDFILLAVSLYGLYAFNGQKTELARKVMGGAGARPAAVFKLVSFHCWRGAGGAQAYSRGSVAGLQRRQEVLEAADVRFLPLGIEDTQQPGLYNRLSCHHACHRSVQRRSCPHHQHKRRKQDKLCGGSRSGASGGMEGQPRPGGYGGGAWHHTACIYRARLREIPAARGSGKRHQGAV
jgi:putative ABC transport system permease protein